MGDPNVSEWLSMMSDTVTIKAYLSRSVSGVISYSPTAVSYRARIEMKNHLTVDRNGRTVTARGRVFMATTTVPGMEDLLTLPGTYQPTQPPIIAVNAQTDDTGIHHVTLEIG